MAVEYILLEDGSGHIALEDASGAILLESSDFAQSLSDTISLTLSETIGADDTATLADTISLATDESIAKVSTGTAVEPYSGGFETAYERQLLERRRDREREALLADEAQAAAQGDEVQAEVARFLHHQLALDSERIELERLRKLVAAHSQVAASAPAVLSAFDRAKATQSFSRLQALQRAYVRMMEEEEFAVAMVLMTLD